MALPTTLPTLAGRNRDERIRVFIIILSALNVPILFLGILDLRYSVTSLILALVVYLYYAGYYLLLRAGYGVLGTYGCVVMLNILFALGLHNSAGSLAAGVTLYCVLLVGVGLVLDEPRALDFALACCLLSYGLLVVLELFVEPPAVFGDMYRSTNSIAHATQITMTLISLLGVWLVMRRTSFWLRQSTASLEAARAEAEHAAHTNASLAAQIQSTNDSLLATQTQLRETIDALALPLIPIKDHVVLLPIVGYLDHVRAGALVNTLLEGIHTRRAHVAIIDITGLRGVNASTGQTLLQAVQASALLGTQVVISGISAETARTLVELGADTRSLQTTSRLSDALRLADRLLDSANRDERTASPSLANNLLQR